MLLNIELDYFNRCASNGVRATQPHLYVVRGGGREVLHKPWGIDFPLWIITASAGGATPLSIPERIADLKGAIVWLGGPIGTEGCITEVVTSYESWNVWGCSEVSVNARTFPSWIRCCFI